MNINMVNGNYILHGDRPTSESEIVDDHVQTRTAERKTKRKVNRTANDLENTIHQAQLDNETDSVKYKKKINEPKLLRYVPTSEVEYHYVSQQFETHDLKPALESARPTKYSYVKKPKNPADGPIHNAYSRSSSSSPTSILPTISENCEQYSGTYRPSCTPDSPKYDSRLDKYFANKVPALSGFSDKVDYNGSHPDSLYRVPPGNSASGLWGERGTRVVRALRLMCWPAALVLVCIALAGFVYFLMPDSMISDRDGVNSTFWDNNLLRLETLNGEFAPPSESTTNQPENISPAINNGKAPEIDFYNPEIDVITLLTDSYGQNQETTQRIPPVFPDHITPEVQYGNEKADTRAPKLLERVLSGANSTKKPHITLKPEKPLAIYFKDTAATESITRAETINDLGNERQNTKSDDSKHNTLRGMEVSSRRIVNNYQLKREQELPSEFEITHRQPPQDDAPLTSGHSKFFGISIEDVEKMGSSTTQSSVYNTRVSPTLPPWRDGDDATTKNYPVASDVSVPQCQSPRLQLCRGVLPYDLAGKPPTIDGLELVSLMPQIEYLISTNCSERMRLYLCAILEPECSPAPYPPKLPCFNFCKAMVESCEGSIPRELSTAFQCKQYSRVNNNCAAVRSPCAERESTCGDGTCIPRDWTCDGKVDCPGGDDETECTECNNTTEYRCASGGCIRKQWVCDGYRDCQNGDDEDELACEGLSATSQPLLGTEPGEESAGSAPAPSVREPSQQNRFGTGQPQFETSQELLITSDSTNALKRNFMRRPSISRLTPYVRKFRTSTTTEPQVEQETETEKTFAPSKTTSKQSLPSHKHDSIEDVVMGDVGILEEFEKENVTPAQQQYLSTPSSVVHPPVASALAENPGKSFDKHPNTYERIIFDGTALMMQAAMDAEKALEELEATDSDELGKRNVRIGTSHTSPCPTSELRCVDGRCITLAQLCDGTIDCSDHADEDNCYT